MSSIDELTSLLEDTRRELGEARAEVARNAAQVRRAQRRERRLLQAETLDALMRALTEGLRDSYGLPYVSLVLCDPDHDIRHLLLANGTPTESFEHLIELIVAGARATA
jgi:uncharacterized protein YigA (DUF484 family)